MKAIFCSLVLLLTASSAFAVNFDDGSGDNVRLEYISWCNGTQVIGQNSHNESYVKYDCAETQKVCKEQSFFRLERVVVMASCFEKTNH